SFFEALALNGINVDKIEEKKLDKILNRILSQEIYQKNFKYSIAGVKDNQALTVYQNKESALPYDGKNIHWYRFLVAVIYIIGVGITVLRGDLLNVFVSAAGVTILVVAAVKTAEVYNLEHPDNKVDLSVVENFTKKVDPKTIGEGLVNYFKPKKIEGAKSE